jgi:hypothetical protein
MRNHAQIGCSTLDVEVGTDDLSKKIEKFWVSFFNPRYLM